MTDGRHRASGVGKPGVFRPTSYYESAPTSYYESAATLADVERFCRIAREQGGSDDDEMRVPLVLGWAPIRGLKVFIDLAHNREDAFRKDHDA